MRYSRFRRADEGVEVNGKKPVAERNITDAEIVEVVHGGSDRNNPVPGDSYFMVDGVPMSHKQLFKQFKAELGQKVGMERYRNLLSMGNNKGVDARPTFHRDNENVYQLDGGRTPYTNPGAMKMGEQYFDDARQLEREAADMRMRNVPAGRTEEMARVARIKGEQAQGNMGQQFRTTLKEGREGMARPKDNINRFLGGLSRYEM